MIQILISWYNRGPHCKLHEISLRTPYMFLSKVKSKKPTKGRQETQKQKANWHSGKYCNYCKVYFGEHRLWPHDASFIHGGNRVHSIRVTAWSRLRGVESCASLFWALEVALRGCLSAARSTAADLPCRWRSENSEVSVYTNMSQKVCFLRINRDSVSSRSEVYRLTSSRRTDNKQTKNGHPWCRFI